MDSTLVTGLLSRLDVVAQKLGVGAEALWGIWLATSWRYALGNVVTPLLLAGMFGVLSTKLFRKAYENSDWEEAGFALGAITGVITLICVIVAIVHLSNAIAFLAVPELYALEQLKALLGGGQ